MQVPRNVRVIPFREKEMSGPLQAAELCLYSSGEDHLALTGSKKGDQWGFLTRCTVLPRPMAWNVRPDLTPWSSMLQLQRLSGTRERVLGSCSDSGERPEWSGGESYKSDTPHLEKYLPPSLLTFIFRITSRYDSTARSSSFSFNHFQVWPGADRLSLGFL